MIPSRVGISLGFALLALSWIEPASAAELDIGKFFNPAPTLKRSSESHPMARLGLMSRQPTRLALQDPGLPNCFGSACVGLFLGVGY
jgi:hypothetical protein